MSTYNVLAAVLNTEVAEKIPRLPLTGLIWARCLSLNQSLYPRGWDLLILAMAGHLSAKPGHMPRCSPFGEHLALLKSHRLNQMRVVSQKENRGLFLRQVKISDVTWDATEMISKLFLTPWKPFLWPQLLWKLILNQSSSLYLCLACLCPPCMLSGNHRGLDSQEK